MAADKFGATEEFRVLAELGSAVRAGGSDGFRAASGVAAAGISEATGWVVAGFRATDEIGALAEFGAVAIFGSVDRSEASCGLDETGAVGAFGFGRRGSQGRTGRGSITPSKAAGSILTIWAPVSFKIM